MIVLIIIFTLAILSASVCIAEGLAEGRAEMEEQEKEYEANGNDTRNDD